MTAFTSWSTIRFVVATGTRTAIQVKPPVTAFMNTRQVLAIDAVHLAYLPSKLVHAFHELLGFHRFPALT